MANSYMFAQGTRFAAMPRSTTPTPNTAAATHSRMKPVRSPLEAKAALPSAPLTNWCKLKDKRIKASDRKPIDAETNTNDS